MARSGFYAEVLSALRGECMFASSSTLITDGTSSFGNTFAPMTLAKFNLAREEWMNAEEFAALLKTEKIET
jgi:hypothetical protein